MGRNVRVINFDKKNIRNIRAVHCFGVKIMFLCSYYQKKNKSLCSYYLNKVKKQEGNFVIPLFCCTFAGAIVVKLQV